MGLIIDTPKISDFQFEKNGKLMVLGVPIQFKHKKVVDINVFKKVLSEYICLLHISVSEGKLSLNCPQYFL